MAYGYAATPFGVRSTHKPSRPNQFAAASPRLPDGGERFFTTVTGQLAPRVCAASDVGCAIPIDVATNTVSVANVNVVAHARRSTNGSGVCRQAPTTRTPGQLRQTWRAPGVAGLSTDCLA
jgi:hypothetical protein